MDQTPATNRRFPIGTEVLSETESSSEFGRRFAAASPRSSNPGPRPPWRGSRAVILAAGRRAPSSARYRFRLDDDPNTYPDPASRFQPDGPHGPSEIVDPKTFQWTDSDWPGVSLLGQVIYELHVGTFTQEGTWAAAAESLGLFEGCWDHRRGSDARRGFSGDIRLGLRRSQFVCSDAALWPAGRLSHLRQSAHSLGLGVILDVVYNHIGPDGNYLAKFSPGTYTTDRYETDYGDRDQLRRTRCRSSPRILHD